MALESWELILFQLAVGSLISGVILFLFSSFTFRFHPKFHRFNKFNKNSTPIMLILASFLLMFGAVGTSIYQSQVLDPIGRLLLVILFPIGFVKVISIVWNKYTQNDHGVDIPTVSIDNQVLTLTNVDEYGGLVLADTGNYDKPETLRLHDKMKMQARTLPGILIERDSIAYVVDIDEKHTLIIDSWPKLSKKNNVA